MAGEDPGFDADDFRTQITAAMTMGLPQDVALRPTFRFTTTKTYALADAAGAPFDYTATPTATETPRADVQIPCAVEIEGQAVEFRAVGQLNAARATLTILDTHWPQVEGFDEVVLGGNTYLYSQELPPLGLFDVTVHQVVVQARDES